MGEHSLFEFFYFSIIGLNNNYLYLKWIPATKPEIIFGINLTAKLVSINRVFNLGCLFPKLLMVLAINIPELRGNIFAAVYFNNTNIFFIF